MRRAFTAILAAATLVAGFSVAPAAAIAGDGERYEYGYDNGRNDRDSRRGYWERPGDRRRGGNWNRYNRRGHERSGPHYYPGYGYYEGRGYGHGRGNERSEWCARRYRSYDWNTGTYVTHDGRRRYCG